MGSKEFVEAKGLCKAAIRGAEGSKDKEDKVMAAFKAWDKDGNDKISEAELTAVLESIGSKMKKGDIKKLLKAADHDKDGEISFSEMTGLIYRAPYLEKYMKEMKKLLEKH